MHIKFGNYISMIYKTRMNIRFGSSSVIPLFLFCVVMHVGGMAQQTQSKAGRILFSFKPICNALMRLGHTAIHISRRPTLTGLQDRGHISRTLTGGSGTCLHSFLQKREIR
jgi:hypothetical protein